MHTHPFANSEATYQKCEIKNKGDQVHGYTALKTPVAVGAVGIDYSCATVSGRVKIAGSRRTKETMRATRVGVGTVPYYASNRWVWVGRVKCQQHKRPPSTANGERSSARSSHGALRDRTMRSIWLVLSSTDHRTDARFFEWECVVLLRASAIETGECAVPGVRPIASN